MEYIRNQLMRTSNIIQNERIYLEDNEYAKLGVECVKKAYELLESHEWKVEKITSKGDTISTASRDQLGKIYRITGKVKYPARLLLEELFYKIDNIPKWNPTILQSKILHRVSSNTDISYQVTTGGGAGLVKSRDFVNLRCWCLYKDGKIIADSDSKDESDAHDDDDADYVDDESAGCVSQRGGKCETKSPMASEKQNNSISEDTQRSGHVFVSAAFSIDYPTVPENSKLIRGENLISCWAMREIENNQADCIFEWIMCVDMKGHMPRYFMDIAFAVLMQDYMCHLRKYCKESQQKQRKKS